MTLQIRDARARELAEKLARKRKVTMTAAVIQALEEELKRETAKVPLSQRIARIAGDLKAQGGPNGRVPSKQEIDDLWGQP
ncbi:type II toxin-antitoxin system VapB family antitoxin [Aliirhizobium terrae]|uniref:type II toxin-antitoxin system VapB family antitoxin n=1 Tax=Terrirhizobium terrae TaxID=2926709 RepID=UPI002575E956|nr:type II toxin-antitoxin system VapB family antitoxin [Rhizobium sp. CC-CFT758]WJH41256.1 type II toxin-antitoxin system VapB family antitoxin [Rhizobium sp. CC-CFT758]